MVVLHGHGSNGKSLLLNTVAHVMDELAGTMPLGAFDQRNIKVQHLYIAECRGKRVMLASEVSKRAEFNEQLVKSLASKDKQQGRRYWENYAEFAATHKVMFAVNHLPKLADFSDAMLRRLAVVQHRRTFPQDGGQLERQLRAEASGILNWMLQGYAKWSEQGLKPLPAAITAEVARYRDSHDTMGEFMASACRVGADQRVRRPNLWKHYRGWADANRIDAHDRLKRTEFYNELRARGFEEVKTMGEHIFWGIGIL